MATGIHLHRPAERRRDLGPKLIRVGALVAVILTNLIACTDPNFNPFEGSCEKALAPPSTEETPGVPPPPPPQPPPDYGTPTPQAPSTTMDLEVTRDYIVSYIEATTAPRVGDNAGLDITNVQLGDGASVNQIRISFHPMTGQPL